MKLRALAIFGILTAWLLPSICAPAKSQTYPAREVRLITESIGSSADYLARYIGEQLSRKWNFPIAIDNQGGRSALLVAKSAPDGYTLLMGSTGSMATAPSMSKTPDYDPVRDFSPIALVSKSPLLVVARPSVPAATLREFIEYARKSVERLRYSSGGIGTAAHLTTAYLASAAGIETVHVPYKGAAAGLKALLAGETHYAAISASTVVPHVRTNSLRAYAVTTTERYPVFPEIPTASESGLAGFEATAWYGLLAPAATPPTIVSKINTDVVSILRQPEVTAAFLKQGAIGAPGTAEEFGAWIRNETFKWAKAVRAAGINPE